MSNTFLDCFQPRSFNARLNYPALTAIESVYRPAPADYFQTRRSSDQIQARALFREEKELGHSLPLIDDYAKHQRLPSICFLMLGIIDATIWSQQGHLLRCS